MENDGEEFYLCRVVGYKDICCFIYFIKNCIELVKVNLLFVGLFVRFFDDVFENFILLF